jgi:hypothetical protein
MTTITVLSFNNYYEKINVKKIYDETFIEIPMHLKMNGLYPDLEEWIQKDVINDVIMNNQELALFLKKNKRYNVAIAFEHIILFPDFLFKNINVNDNEIIKHYLNQVEVLMNLNNDDMIYRLIKEPFSKVTIMN